jgi:hypothetical protein
MTRINIQKYNYALDEEVQDFGSQEGFLEIPANGKEINIYNKKIVINNEYMLEADPNEVEKMKQ